MMRNLFTQITLSLVFIFFINGCATNPVTGKRDFMLMSESEEIALGKQSDPEIVNFYGLYQNDEIQQFIDTKGQQMAAKSHRPDLPYEFKIVDSPVVNAFAVPGGFVYFTRGIMAHFNNEAEFAGVLGHEIGHITARHSAKQYSRAMIAQVGLAVGTVVSPEFRKYANIANTGVGLLFLKFGRDAESQSDRLGVQYSSDIGYDAHEMAGFFNTLARMRPKGGQATPTFLSTHPDPANRYQNVNKLATKYQKKEVAKEYDVNRNSYLRMIDGLVYGEDPKQGFVENSVFYHPVLKFRYSVPQGWQLQNSPQQVQMAQEDGKAVMTLTLAGEKSLSEASQAFVQQNKLTVVESKNTTVNGLNAIALITDQVPQESQQQSTQEQPTLRILSYFIDYANNIYNITGLTTRNDFNNYASLFSNTMKSFSRLTDPNKINVKADRIKIRTVQRTATLNAALTSLGVPNDQLEELAVLNGMELTDTVEKGMLIKILGK